MDAEEKAITAAIMRQATEEEEALQEDVKKVGIDTVKLDDEASTANEVTTSKAQETGLQDLAEGFASLGQTLGLVEQENNEGSDKKIVSVRNEDLIGKN